MEGNTNIHQTASECISQDVLIKYIKGELDGKTMNRVERHLSGCPMCADELEGLQELDNPEEIQSIKKELNSLVDSRIYRQERKVRVAYIARIAAVLVLVMSVSVLVIYFLNINRNDNFLSENAELELAEEEIPLEIADMPYGETMKEDEISKEIVKAEKAKPKPVSAEPVIIEDIVIVDDDFEIGEGEEMGELDFVMEEPAKLADSEVSPPVTHQESNAIAGGVAQQQPVSISSKAAESRERKKTASETIYLFDSGKQKDSLELKPAEQDTYIVMNIAEEEEVEEDEVFVMVEQMPYFADSNGDSFNTYLLKNRRYPEEAAENGIQGKVYVEFFVERDGSISNVKVIRGVDPMLDKEAVRLIESCPKWKPGMQRGRPVRVKMSVPITFEIH